MRHEIIFQMTVGTGGLVPTSKQLELLYEGAYNSAVNTLWEMVEELCDKTTVFLTGHRSM
jgi:hypothetical protein